MFLCFDNPAPVMTHAKS